MKHLVIFLSAMTNLIFSGFVGAQDNDDLGDYWLGSARGAYATGTMIETWVDEQRDELSTSDENDKRRITVQIWYPAMLGGQVEFAPYAPNIDSYAQYVIDWGSPLAGRPTRSVLDAPVDNTASNYPIIIYSPGGGSQVFTGTSQTEFLASHGYVVVSVEHTDDSGRIRFPDGTDYTKDVALDVPSVEERQDWSQLKFYHWLAENLQFKFAWYVKDISFVLDRLKYMNESVDSPFYQRLDTGRVGVMGWSNGGANAFQASLDEPRIKAAVNLDGTIYGRPVERLGTEKPVLFLETTFGRFDPLTSTTVNPDAEEFMSYIESTHWGMFRLSTADWYRAKIVGSKHSQLSDVAIGSGPLEDGLIPNERAREIANAVVLEFFEKYLNGSNETPLLSMKKSYPELRLFTKLVDSDKQ